MGKNFGHNKFTLAPGSTDYNCNIGSNYRLYRKITGAPDSTYEEVCSNDASYGAITGCNFNGNLGTFTVNTSNGAMTTVDGGDFTFKFELNYSTYTEFFGYFCFWSPFPPTIWFNPSFYNNHNEIVIS